MKKAKLTLALVAGLVATIGLTSCDTVTEKAGAVLTYTDGFGNSTVYTAAELFGDYQNSSSASSTNYDKVYEVLIRKYYGSGKVGAAILKQLKNKATISVDDDMKSAHSNAENGTNTSYAAELEKIFASHGVETIEEDYDYWLFQHEKDHFESEFYKKHLDELKNYGFDGDTATTNKLNNGKYIEGVTDEGYLKEKMPYHVRHILAEVAAASNEICQGKITKENAETISKIIIELAKGEKSFGEISETYSKDRNDLTYGDLGKMDLDESYVNEFKLGVYAYETLYSGKEDGGTFKNNYTLNESVAKRIAPVGTEKVKDGATSKTTKEYFESKGIGEIPFGAALALAKAADVDASKLSYKINEDNESFLPRNIIFNKYFNKHNICVITPDDCAYNAKVDADGKAIADADKEATAVAAYSETIGTLIGTPYKEGETVKFEEYYKNFKEVPALDNKTVLTSEGKVVLAVRAGSSGSYEGIHFIIIERSALDETVKGNAIKADGTIIDNVDVTLDEYWTTEYTDSANFPKTANGEKKVTYVNRFKQDSTVYKERADKVTGYVKGYNKNISSYIFGWLVKENNITFTDEYKAYGDKIQEYLTNKVVDADYTANKSRENAWKTYAEYLIQQDAMRDIGKTDGKGYLISETCAIGYLSHDGANPSGVWAKGGACYYEK